MVLIGQERVWKERKKEKKNNSLVTVTVTAPGAFARGRRRGGGGASLVGVCFDLISCCRFDIMIPGMSEKKIR